MLEINKNHCGDTVEMMKKIDDKSIQLVVTSPPYNKTKRTDGLNNIYDKAVHDDNMTDEDYIQWMVNVFKEYDRILKDTGVVAFNMSYSTYSPSLPYFVINEIFKNTNFIIADTVSWEKSSCIPTPGHPQALTRRCELVYIFVKKQHLEDYEVNKEVQTLAQNTGQKFYRTYFNILRAKNNDGKIEGHGATFSSDFAKFFIDLYSFPDTIVLDNFMGTGTTGVAALELGRYWIGIDNSQAYIDIADERISKVEFVGHRLIREDEEKVKKPRKSKKTEEIKEVEIYTDKIVGTVVLTDEQKEIVNVTPPKNVEKFDIVGNPPKEVEKMEFMPISSFDTPKEEIKIEMELPSGQNVTIKEPSQEELDDFLNVNTNDELPIKLEIPGVKEKVIEKIVETKKPTVSNDDDWFDQLAGV